MYKMLFEIWKKEIEDKKLTKVSPDFYFQIGIYLKKLKEERRMLDEKTLKARLLKKEMSNVRKMLGSAALIFVPYHEIGM